VTRLDLFHPAPEAWDRAAAGRAILDAAVAEHNPLSIWGLFSGGHDSLCATHLASSHPRFAGVAHFATGTGIKETKRYVYEVCRAQGWPLRVYRPRVGDRYEDFARAHGLPGPAQHGRMYNRLKERSLERHIAATKTRWNDRVMLITGCRAAESERRMGHTTAISRFKTRVWVAPCIDWLPSDQHAYMREHALPANPVKELLHVSGECLCGAFGRGAAELEEIRLWYPRAADEIDRVAAVAAANGKPCRWGERPNAAAPEDVDDAQCDLGDPTTGASIRTMCWSCGKRPSAEVAA